MQNMAIWGTASIGTCSIVFGVTPDGYDTLYSREIAGDVHSIAWSPDGHNLHALNSRSSQDLSTSITNFRMSELPTLQDIVGVDVLGNVTSASQIVAHPSESFVYIVTKDSNELVVVSLAGDTLVGNSTLVMRHRLLPTSLDAKQFHSSSLAISASRHTLWTLSQSAHQAVITCFTLNVTTGEVIDIAARASWQGFGEGQLTAAPFEVDDVVAVANSPTGYITILGLDQGGVSSADVAGGSGLHNYLHTIKVDESRRNNIRIATPKIKSYGRVLIDEYVNLGDCVWID
jgi:hypothetical protein